MTTGKQMTRRVFNKGAAAVVVSASVPAGCSSDDTAAGYEELVAATWRHAERPGTPGRPLLKELVRYGTLAANSHNSQPCRFRIDTNRISVQPDFSRRCPAVDPDDHHLFASLGCAAENIAIAAAAHGLRASVSLDTAGGDTIRIDLEASPAADSPAFRAITERQCTRAAYDGKPVAVADLASLERVAADDGVATQVFTAEADKERILEYVVAGNTAQMRDEAFVTELRDWLRFNESAAVEHRDGLFSATTGNPTMPTWIGRIAFGLFFREGSENDKYRDHIRSSAGVMAFVAGQNDRQGWIDAGRSYQRFALAATALGLRHAFVNQAIEVPDVRTQFADYLGIGDRRPNLLVRFGYGPTLPQSLRRPVNDVLSKE